MREIEIHVTVGAWLEPFRCDGNEPLMSPVVDGTFVQSKHSRFAFVATQTTVIPCIQLETDEGVDAIHL